MILVRAMVVTSVMALMVPFLAAAFAVSCAAAVVKAVLDED